jgi:hypothetical protein
LLYGCLTPSFYIRYMYCRKTITITKRISFNTCYTTRYSDRCKFWTPIESIFSYRCNRIRNYNRRKILTCIKHAGSYTSYTIWKHYINKISTLRKRYLLSFSKILKFIKFYNIWLLKSFYSYNNISCFLISYSNSVSIIFQ